MKRAIIAAILGLTASVVTSYGYAFYAFDTYLPREAEGAPSGQIVWGPYAPDGLAGTVANNNQNLVANLLWQVGTASGIANVGPVGVDQYGYIEVEESTPTGAGYTLVTFDPSYVNFTPITFTIEVWQKAPGITGYSDAIFKGSETWIDPGEVIDIGPQIFNPSTFPGSPIFVGVPEPTALALAGLCGAGLLIFRRRQ